MPSYTVTYGDDRPSRPSSKFANPAHGIMGVLGTSGSDPRERGRKRSRQEIEASSRAEYLAKKEHLAKIKGMRDTEKAAEAEKKTSAARARVLARPDVQEQIDAKEGNRLQQEARKAKKVERLTPEQIAAKEKAIVDRDRSNATSRIATMDKLMSERMKPEGPSLMDSLNKPVTINDWLGTSGPDLRPEQYPAQYDHSADDAARAAAPAKPAATALSTVTATRGADRGADPNLPFGGYQPDGDSPARIQMYDTNFDKPALNNSPEFRKQVEEYFTNPSGRATSTTPGAPISDRYVRPEDREPSFSFIEGRGGYSGDTTYGLRDPTKSPAAMLPFMENPNYKP